MNKFLKLIVKPLAVVVFLSLLFSSCHPHVKSISRKKLKRGQTYRPSADDKNSVALTMSPIVPLAE